jgi:hypothetical protein
MYDTKFLTAVAERAIKTFAQTLLATIGADSAGVLDATTVDAAKVAAGATLLSILTSFASSATGRSGPSLASETTDPDVEFILPTPVTASTASKTTTNAASTKATVKVTPAKNPTAKKKPAAKKTEQ